MMISRAEKKPRRNDGFTLIELALVALIVLMLVGLSTPLFKETFSDLTIKDTSYSISKLINYGQEKAILDRTNYKMRFDFKARQYRLLKLDTSSDAPSFKPIGGRFGRIFTLPDSLLFRDLKGGSAKELIFYPDGACDETRIDIIDKRQKGYSITVKGFGGHNEIKEIKDTR